MFKFFAIKNVHFSLLISANDVEAEKETKQFSRDITSRLYSTISVVTN